MTDQAASTTQVAAPKAALSRRNSLREILDIIDALKSSHWRVLDIPISFSPEHGIFSGWKYGGGVGTPEKVVFVKSVLESKENEFLDPSEFLLPGDVLLMVGNRCLLHANLNEATELMRSIPSPARMLVARRVFATGSVRIDITKPEYFSDVAQRFLCFSIRKTTDRLGFHISGGSDTKLPHILVKAVADNSVAAPYIRHGDRLVVSNGIRLLAVSHQQAVEALKSANTIELLIERVPSTTGPTEQSHTATPASTAQPESGSLKPAVAQGEPVSDGDGQLRVAKPATQERPHSAPVEAPPVPLMQSFLMDATALPPPPLRSPRQPRGPTATTLIWRLRPG